MSEQRSYTTSITVDHTPSDVFAAVVNPRAWWSAGITGDTSKVGDEFYHRYEDVHFSHLRVTEATLDSRVEWLVLENSFNFVEDETEWVGTVATFEITPVEGGTEFRFTHHGLVPEYECYEACSQGWTYYIGESLRDLITTGKGHPNAEGTARTAAERELSTKTTD